MHPFLRFAPVAVATIAIATTLGPVAAHAGAFECHASQIVRAPVALDGLAIRVSKREDIRILAIGSSSTEGVGASSRENSYPSRLEAILRGTWPTLGIAVTNAGIGGETAPETVERLKSMLRERRFDLVIWQVGTNDAVGGGDLPAFERMLVEGIDAADEAGVPLAVMDPQFFPGIKDPDRYGRYVRTIGAVARARGVAIVSRFDVMTNWSQQDGFAETLAADRFHLSDVGYDCLARNVASAIVAMVRASTTPLVALTPRAAPRS